MKLLQLNVKLKLGELTREGHTFQNWQKFHTEFFDDVSIAEAAKDYWESIGVKAEFGELSEKMK